MSLTLCDLLFPRRVLGKAHAEVTGGLFFNRSEVGLTCRATLRVCAGWRRCRDNAQLSLALEPSIAPVYVLLQYVGPETKWTNLVPIGMVSEFVDAAKAWPDVTVIIETKEKR